MEISQTGYKTSPCWLPDDKGYCQSPSAAGTMADERNSRSMSMTGNERSYIKQSRVCVNMKIHRAVKNRKKRRLASAVTESPYRIVSRLQFITSSPLFWSSRYRWCFSLLIFMARDFSRSPRATSPRFLLFSLSSFVHCVDKAKNLEEESEVRVGEREGGAR